MGDFPPAWRRARARYRFRCCAFSPPLSMSHWPVSPSLPGLSSAPETAVPGETGAVAPTPENLLGGLRVLLVEDEPVTRYAIAAIVAPRVAQLWQAGDGDEAWELFRQHRPDVVLTDLQMPGRDGLSLTREVKALDPHVPVIIATSFGDSERLLQAIEAGVDRYVLKPIQARAVLDVLQAVAVQARVRLEHRLAASVFRNASEAILITDGENRIVDANPAFTRITGYSRDEVLGANPRLLRSGNQSADFYREMWSALNADGHWRGEIWNRRKNGELYPEWLSIDRVSDDDGKVINYIAMWSDISERKEAEARINYLAHYDVLTDLPNRVLFADRFQQALVHARRTSQNVALLFLDLDRFKRVNDSLGHRAGDQLLQTIAARLKECVREDDTVSRRGGDEFVILLSGLSRPQQAGAVASKILAALARPVLCEGQEIAVSASIGIACYPQDGVDGESLVVNADLAMYRAKQMGRDNYQYFSADLETGTEDRLQLEVDMRHGLERGEFELFYLPQLDNVTDQVHGIESLIRWHHPRLGLLLPGDFLPLAEDTGLIQPLTHWILGTAVRQLAAWRNEGLTLLRLAVNLSQNQLRLPHFVDDFARLLQQEGLEGRWFVFEFPEAVLMQNSDSNLELLAALKALGVGITLDDFGSGYSNLNLLQKLPVDTVKIDRSLVARLGRDQADSRIVDALISLAGALQLKVVAEGVETADQAGFFKGRACAEIQGHFYTRPINATAMEAFLHRPGKAA